VQGDKAAEQIAGAINGFNKADGFPRPDVLIVARGGGSMEDLWCFNEEVVARAAANSKIPLISAAVLAPARQRLDSSRASLPPISRLLDPKKNALARHGQALQSAMRFTKQRQVTKLAQQGETLTRYGRTAEAALKRQLETQSRRLDRAGKLLDAYSYKGTLDRGFALVRDDTGKVIRSKSVTKSGQGVSLTFADGEIGAVIAGAPAAKRPRKSASSKPDKKQADLF